MKGIEVFLRKGFLGIASAFVLASVGSAQTVTVGILRDEGGAVFNVKSYGATGNGTTNDSPYIQLAINAAVTAGGGVVYVPAGTYLINATLTNNRADIVSIVGSGMGSELKINTSVGLSMPTIEAVLTQFHSASIEHLRFVCTNTSIDIAVQMTDMVSAPALTDLTVASCNVGFDLINNSYWTERLTATNINDHYNNHLFHYDQNPSDGANSYGYGRYDGIFVDKGAGQDVFYLTGGAYLYHSTFIIKGNFATSGAGASIFNVQGASGQGCPSAAGNVYDIAVEGAEYQVVNAANNGCTGGGSGNSIVEGSGSINAIGAVASNNLIRTVDNTPYLAGILTTTAASSDTLTTSPNPRPGSTCYVQPQNATAASMASGSYVSTTNWSSVTVTHPATAGGIFSVWCALL